MPRIQIIRLTTEKLSKNKNIIKLWIYIFFSKFLVLTIKYRRRIKILKPFYNSSILFIFCLIYEKLGISKFSEPSIDPVSWTIFFTEGCPRAFYVSLAFFLWLCFWEFRKKKRE